MSARNEDYESVPDQSYLPPGGRPRLLSGQARRAPLGLLRRPRHGGGPHDAALGVLRLRPAV